MRVGNFRISDFEKLPKLVAEIFLISLGKTYSEHYSKTVKGTKRQKKHYKG
jgi:hypothetical protein